MNLRQLLLVLRRRRAFRWLFFGMLFSRTGDAIGLVALSWLTLNIAGPRQLGLILFTAGVAAAVSAQPAGHLVDRFGIRPMLLAENLARAVIMTSVPVLLWTHALHLGYLYAAATLSAFFSSATEVGQEAIIPAIVPDAELDAANTLASLIWDGAAFLGPAVTGVIIQRVGIPAAFLVDVASFLAMSLTAIMLPGRLPDTRAGAGHPRHEEAEEAEDGRLSRLLIGLRTLWQLRTVTAMTVIGLGVLAVGGAMEVFMPIYSREVLHAGALGYGLLASVAGIGSLAGTIFLTRYATRLRPGVALCVLLGLRALLLLPLALVRLLPVACAFMAGTSAADGPYYPISRSIIQRTVPAHLRGRVLGARLALSAGAFPLGAALAGLALGAFSVAAVLVGMAAVYVPLIVIALRARGLMRSAE
ncbi:MAG: MFS transporter [Actinomycetota bacterium]|nr:MFS transporter [Actinomycetota bacterium]